MGELMAGGAGERLDPDVIHSRFANRVGDGLAVVGELEAGVGEALIRRNETRRLVRAEVGKRKFRQAC